MPCLGLGAGLALRLAASRSIIPSTFRPGTVRSWIVDAGVAGGATGASGAFAAGVASTGACAAGAGAGAGASVGGLTGGAGGLTTGAGGVTFNAGGAGGLGGAGGATGRVPITKLSAFFLTAADFENSSCRLFSISGVTFAIGLLSISKPFPLRNSTIVEVPTFNSFATITSRLLIRTFKHLSS